MSDVAGRTDQRAALHAVEDVYDFLKYLTTLSTGAVVVLATFSEGLLRSNSPRWLVGASLTAFLTSAACALVSMFFVLSTRRHKPEAPDWEQYILIVAFLAAVIALLAGAAFLADYVVVGL
jgi:hypothetical protein